MELHLPQMTKFCLLVMYFASVLFGHRSSLTQNLSDTRLMKFLSLKRDNNNANMEIVQILITQS